MSSERVLEVTGLTKRYQAYANPLGRLREVLLNRREAVSGGVEALSDVSFSLNRGEIFGVIGPNGSGKSTLLQMIAGTLKPSAGSIDVQGRLTALLELGAGMDRQMTGRENIFLMGATYGLTQAEIVTKVKAIIDFSGLGAFIDRPVTTYSSGMAVRLAFSVSTALDPDVLIVDEALAVGDIGFQAKCLDRLEHLIQQGSSILLASHDMQLIKNYCSSAICLGAGRIIESGDPQAVTERYLMLMRQSGQLRGQGMHWKNVSNGAAGFSMKKASRIDDVDVVSVDSRPVIRSGESVTVAVEGHIGDRDVVPVVSLMLRDARGYNIYGLKAHADRGHLDIDENGAFTSSFILPMHVAKGDYSFTVRLLDYRTERVFEVLDKHVGVCRLTVEASGEGFLGSVNLHGEVCPAGAGQASENASGQHGGT